MTECCPTCGRPTQARFHTAFREKLIRLADGTRSAAELARLTGTTRGSVHVALTSLRQQGLKVKAKPRVFTTKVLTKAEYTHLEMLRMQGLTWREIGKLQQSTPSHLAKLFCEAKKCYDLGLKKKAATEPVTTSVCAS